MTNEVDLSVLVPVGSRFDDVRAVFNAYREALDGLDLSYEIIYVLDGPRPEVLDVLKSAQTSEPKLQILQLARFFGEATAIVAGFEISQGKKILTLPAYFQIDPAEIGKMLAEKGDNHMVVAHRWPRRGSSLEKFRRRIFHGLIAGVTGQRFRDLGCSVRLLDREILEELSIYGDQHRFLPLIAERSGFRVVEVDIRQSPQDDFRGHYRLREYVRRILDIFTIFFLTRFTKKPLRFFGMVGSVVLAVGIIALLNVVIERLFFGQALADRPALLLGSLFIVLGIQIGALGLLGELIIFTHARTLKEYRVERIVNPAIDESDDGND